MALRHACHAQAAVAALLLLCFGALATLDQASGKAITGVAAKAPKFPASAKFPAELFQHAGYLDAGHGGVQLQYWFFEAEKSGTHGTKNGKNSQPRPTILWLNGGPGCSDCMGLFYENGPFRFSGGGNGGTLERSAFSWTKFANMLYIDSPCGTGLSVCGTAGMATNESRVAGDLYGALTDFFAKKSPVASSALYLFGESYAGKYIPSLAAALLDKPSAIIPKLEGIAIGNGMVDPITQATVYADFAYNAQLIDADQAAQLRVQQDAVVELIKAEKWEEANGGWNNITVNMLEWGGWPDPADIRYYGFSRLNFSGAENFMNDPEVRKRLGVPAEAANRKFSICQSDVQTALGADEMKSVKHILTRLLDSTSVRVLLFTGNFDPAIPVPEGWIASIDWAHQTAWPAAKRAVWKNPATGLTWGYVKQLQQLTFTVVVQSGHQVCMDQQDAALHMAQSFVGI